MECHDPTRLTAHTKRASAAATRTAVGTGTAVVTGDSVEITEGYRSWWSYVPHFMASPGYVYAYAYGQLLALSVYKLYTERGDEMVPG